MPDMTLAALGIPANQATHMLPGDALAWHVLKQPAQAWYQARRDRNRILHALYGNTQDSKRPKAEIQSAERPQDYADASAADRPRNANGLDGGKRESDQRWATALRAANPKFGGKQARQGGNPSRWIEPTLPLRSAAPKKFVIDCLLHWLADRQPPAVNLRLLMGDAKLLDRVKQATSVEAVMQLVLAQAALNRFPWAETDATRGKGKGKGKSSGSPADIFTTAQLSLRNKDWTHVDEGELLDTPIVADTAVRGGAHGNALLPRAKFLALCTLRRAISERALAVVTLLSSVDNVPAPQPVLPMETQEVWLTTPKGT